MKNSLLIQNITSDDLKEIISDAIEEKFNNLTLHQNIASDYLTRQEAANLLRISLPTLAAYTKKGIVKGQRIGSRVLYNRDHIAESLREIQSIKYRRA